MAGGGYTFFIFSGSILLMSKIWSLEPGCRNKHPAQCALGVTMRRRNDKPSATMRWRSVAPSVVTVYQCGNFSAHWYTSVYHFAGALLHPVHNAPELCSDYISKRRG